MTSDGINTEQAWENFKESRAFEKAASVQGQLDTMAAMLQDIQTNTQRTASVIDQLNGDNAAIDYENQNADPMAAMGGMPGAEDMMPPMEEGAPEADATAEGIEDGTADEAGPDLGPETDGMAAGDIPPEEAAVGDDYGPTDEEIDAILNEPVPEDLSSEGSTGGSPAADDMIGKIRNLIANTEDPTILAGLSDLLSTALAQNTPTPMESFAYSADGDTTTDDVNDGLFVIKKEISDCVDSTLGVEAESSYAKNDDGIADVTDAKDAEEATDMKAEDGPDPITSNGEPFKESDDEMIGVEEESEVVPAAEDPVVEEIVDKVAEAVEGIVDSVLNGEDDTSEGTEDISDDTESFEECGAGCDDASKPVMKSFNEMFNDIQRYSPVNGFPEIKKSVPEQNDRKSDDKYEFVYDEDIRKSAEDVPESVAKSAEFSGKHLKSFNEMYNDKQNAFAKTAAPDVSRPGRASMVNGVTDKPTLDPIKKSTLPSFDQMMQDRAQNLNF